MLRASQFSLSRDAQSFRIVEICLTCSGTGRRLHSISPFRFRHCVMCEGRGGRDRTGPRGKMSVTLPEFLEALRKGSRP